MQDLETGLFESEQIGSFFSFAKAQDEFGVSLIGEARIPKRNPVLCETIQTLYQKGCLNFSFEILVSRLKEMNGVCLIDAEDGNELIGMAMVSVPAYPEATALRLVAEQQKREDDEAMDENQKKVAELEAKLMLAEQKSENDEELRKKDEELRGKNQELEQAQAKCQQAEADLTAVQAQLSEKDAVIAERDAALVVKDARIAELEAQVAELTPYKTQAETLQQEKEAAVLAAKRQELQHFAEVQGLDTETEVVKNAIAQVDYAALITEANKKQPGAPKAVVANYVLGGISAKGEYDDLLGKA